MAGRLQGRVAVVTGASRGIGEAIATAYVREGAEVILVSRKQDGLDAAADRIASATGRRPTPTACHVGRADARTRLIDGVFDAHGRLDVLVNNAATNPYFGPLLGTEAAAWDKTFEVNVRGPFELIRQVATRWMEEGTRGSIINQSSILGVQAAPWQGVYGMTKAALISMTKTLAVELGEFGIRVNAIAPGLVETRFAAALTSDEALRKGFEARTALGRIAQPEEIAGAAVFLASDESAYVTGQTLAVDGGFLVR